MSTGLILSGVTPSTFRPNFDSSQLDVSLLVSTITEVLRPDSDRMSILIQNTSILEVTIRFRSLALSQPGIQLKVDGPPLILSFSDFGPIIGDALFAQPQGGPSRVFVLTSSDRGQRG